MPWGRMDDKWHKRRDVSALRRKGAAGLAALGLWDFFVSWCLDDPALDGFVPADELTGFERRGPLQLLLSVGLWIKTDGGFVIQDFATIAPNPEQVEAKREADRVRIAQKRAQGVLGLVPDVARDSHAGRIHARDPVPGPIPTRPDPGPALFPAARGPVHADLSKPGEEPAPDHRQQPLLRPAPQTPQEGPGSLEALRATCEAVEAEQDRQRAAARAAWAGTDLGADLSLGPVHDDDLTAAGADNDQEGTAAARDALLGSHDGDEDLRHEFARRVYQRFVGLYQGTFKEFPSMGGKAVDSFPERLRTTARLREVDPFELMDRTFQVFAREPAKDKHDAEMRQRAPYATYVARFGQYLSKPEAQALAPKDQLRQRMREAMEKSDRTLYDELDSQYRQQYLGGRDARPAQ